MFNVTVAAKVLTQVKIKIHREEEEEYATKKTASGRDDSRHYMRLIPRFPLCHHRTFRELQDRCVYVSRGNIITILHERLIYASKYYLPTYWNSLSTHVR